MAKNNFNKLNKFLSFFILGIISLVIFLGLSLIYFLFNVQAQSDDYEVRNFTATPTSSCAIDLSWNTPSPSFQFDYFELWRSTSSDMSNYVATTLPSSTTNYTDTNLQRNTQYHYQIRTVRTVEGRTDYSPWSYTSTSTLSLGTPSQPSFSSTIIRSDNDSLITLIWDYDWSNFSRSNLIRKFELWRATSSNPSNPYELVAEIDGNLSGDNLYADRVSPNSVYRYILKAYVDDFSCFDEGKIFSPSSTEVIFPIRPTNLDLVFNYSIGRSPSITITWHHDGDGTDFYEIYRKKRGEDFILLATILTTSGNSYNDSNLESNTVYTYKVRACSQNSSGLISCSDFTEEKTITVADAPQNFRAFIVSVSLTNNTATIQLSWENTFPNSNYIIERSENNIDFSELSTVGSGPADEKPFIFYSTSEPLGNRTVYYRVYAKSGTVSSNYSLVRAVNLNITPIKGWAWMGTGLGWVRLSYDSQESSWGSSTQANDSPHEYLTYLDNTNNRILGYAWSPSLGWLSFNEEEGCSSSDSNCQAWVDFSSGDSSKPVQGWASFLTLNENNQITTKWVSLGKKGSEPDYFLYFATTTDINGLTVGSLRGYAWGGDVVGWISFGGPVLKKVIVNPTIGTTSSIDVHWENLINYSGVEIWVKNLNDNTERFLNGDTSKGYHSTTIDNLNPNTRYKVWIKGYY